jgi:hypothetical protein
MWLVILFMRKNTKKPEPTFLEIIAKSTSKVPQDGQNLLPGPYPTLMGDLGQFNASSDHSEGTPVTSTLEHHKHHSNVHESCALISNIET